jgi:hypothetical protein
MTSVPPPALAWTTKVIGLVGYSTATCVGGGQPITNEAMTNNNINEINNIFLFTIHLLESSIGKTYLLPVHLAISLTSSILFVAPALCLSLC